jgi:hypothetical protein
LSAAVVALLRRHRLGSIVVAAVAAALLAVGVALAANSTSYTDASADGGGAPDVGQTSVSNDDQGTITVKIAVANRTDLAATDEVGLGIDVDQNPDTGSVYHYGQEVAFAFDGSTLGFFRASSTGDFEEAPAPPSLKGSFAAGVATLSFSASDIGLGPTSGFNFSVIDSNEVDFDAAPDLRSYNYQLVAGTPPAVPGPDRTPPIDQAIRSSGKRGTVVHLDYVAADGRGETADTIRVFRGRKVLKTIRFALDDTIPFLSYYARWKVPKKIHGKLRFCVRSADRAGNKSKQSCAPLTIR